MSTQQQIDQYNNTIKDLQADRAAQVTIFQVQREEFVKAENARIAADLALQRAQNSGASADQILSLQRQLKTAEAAESTANIAASKTEDNIDRIDGSIRYNTGQRNQFQNSLPATGVPVTTAGDRQANAATDAALTAPAPTPSAATPAPVPVSAIEQGGEGPAQRLPQPAPPQDFVTEEDGTLIPSDSARAEERRAEIAAEEARGRTDAPAPVPGSAIEQGGEQEAQDALAARNAAPEPVPPNLTQAWDPETGSYGVWDEDKGVFVETGLSEEEAAQAANDPFEAARLAREREFEEEQPAVFEPEPVPGSTDLGLQDPAQRAQQAAQQAPLTPEQQAAKEQAAAKENAINQATRQSVYKQGGSTDWRVRLQLSPTSNYLYNAKQPGILGPLFATNGVLFPYTPQIQTSYEAKYTDYDLVHSNFRGVFYQNSRVGDISIRAEFTAQDSNEANYLLAVIHFFRSVTKMFYGKDPQRGTPPPLVYLSGLGMNQFYGHPCLVRQFQYTLPNNVDYIRASTNNNYGTDLLDRLRPASSPSSVAGLGATGNRILNAGLEKFFPANKPAPNSVVASVNNTQLSNYVPTKMEIDISLIPVQTRSQVSKQFSLENFAKGNLIKDGFW
jgi:plasmid maintenance system antidote protein VapI